MEVQRANALDLLPENDAPGKSRHPDYGKRPDFAGNLASSRGGSESTSRCQRALGRQS